MDLLENNAIRMLYCSPHQYQCTRSGGGGGGVDGRNQQMMWKEKRTRQ